MGITSSNWISSLLKAVAQVALGSVQGYHGLVLASGLYGASLGGALYSLKMLALERLRARHFARSWALVQAAEALPILLGVPLTGTLESAEHLRAVALGCSRRASRDRPRHRL